MGLLYVIGRSLSIREVRAPWLYTRTKLDVLFDIKMHMMRDPKENRIKKVFFYEFSKHNNTMPIFILNLIKFFIGIGGNFRSEEPYNGQKVRLSHKKYQHMGHHEPTILRANKVGDGEKRSYD